MDDFVAKPIRKELVAEVIDRHLPLAATPVESTD
jgi:hypothetical protein